MTPEQIQNAVESAFKLRDSFMLIYFILVPIVTVIITLTASYLREKGKNIATKEDIGEITTQVEKAKSEYSEQLEKLKSELAQKSHLSRIRYEREMKVFEDVWPRLHTLRTAVLSLRPVMDTVLAVGETEDGRKEERGTAFFEAYRELALAVEENRPFYPEEVWKELRELLQLTWVEAVDYRLSDQKRDWEKYWDKALENAKAIQEQVEKICEAIRDRLAKFD